MTDSYYRTLQMTLLAGALVVLTGCGVKGPLEPPPGTENIASPNPLSTTVVPDRAGDSVTSTPTQTATSKDFTNTNRVEDVSKDGKKKRIRRGNVPLTTEPQKPDRPFILDDLL